ncbi:MAG: TldD/PmbA family protein [Candidatus Hodarchaeales archaeon]
MNIDELLNIVDMSKRLTDKHNPDEYEIFATYEERTNLNIENGRITGTDYSTENGLGIRIAFGKKVALSFTTDFSQTSIEKMISSAVNAARKSVEDPDWMGLPAKSGIISKNKFFYPKLLETSVEEIAEITSVLLEECKVTGAITPIIPLFGGVGLVSANSVVVNSHGIKAINEAGVFFAYLGALGLIGGKQPGPMELDYYISREKIIPNPSEFSNKIAKEALRLTEAKKVKLPEKMPVVFHPFAMNSIVTNIFLPSVRADIKQQGSSILADRLGEKLVPENFEMFDDGTLVECLSSGHYDAEGVAKQKTPIFEEGIFKNFLYDHTTAKKDDTSSTGNAERVDRAGINPGAYANNPSVSVNNWTVRTGKEDLDDLISDIKLGILIKQVQGAHQGTPESGDYTGVVNPGYIIRNGELTEPVIGLGLAGNILELFNKFEDASSTARALFSAYLPYLKFSEIRIVS